MGSQKDYRHAAAIALGIAHFTDFANRSSTRGSAVFGGIGILPVMVFACGKTIGNFVG